MRIKNRLTFISIWLGVATMALAACGGESERAQVHEATVIVQEIVNRVEVDSLHSDTTLPAFVDLRLGQSLQTGDLVKTYENSSARVDISIENFTRVSRTSPGTIWKLGRFALNGEAVVELQEGKIFVFDEDDGQEHWPLHIVTPAGTASARGTWMAVEFDPRLGTVLVECLRGVCELENDLGYQAFTNQATVGASSVTGPTNPVPMEQHAIEAFRELPEVVSGELPIPVRFTPAQARTKLADVWTAAAQRNAFRQERGSNSAQAPEDRGGPGQNGTSAEGRPIDGGSEPGRPDDPGSQASANRQSGQSDDPSEKSVGANASEMAQDKAGPIDFSTLTEPLVKLGITEQEATRLANQGRSTEILAAIAGVLNLNPTEQEVARAVGQALAAQIAAAISEALDAQETGPPANAQGTGSPEDSQGTGPPEEPPGTEGETGNGNGGNGNNGNGQDQDQD